MVKVLMLLSNPYRPDPRVLREVRILKRAGHRVKIIAWDREGRFPGRSREDDAIVIRVGPDCSFRNPLEMALRLPQFWLSALRRAGDSGYDIIHAHDFDTLPLGTLLSRLSGRPVIYDAHELYSKMISSEIGGLSRLVWAAERYFARRADAVITVNPYLAAVLSEGRKTRARIVANSPDPGVLEGISPEAIREEYGLSGFVLSYLGSLEPGRFVDEMVSSILEIQNVSLAIGGNGTMRRLAEKASLRNQSIKFVGTVDMDEALRITWASDLVVSMLDPANPNYRVSTPAKVLDAMACSRPMVISEGLKMAEVVEEVGCGFVIPYDRRAFTDTVEKAVKSPSILSEMGRRGREYYDRELSWTASKDELLAVYRSLTS